MAIIDLCLYNPQALIQQGIDEKAIAIVGATPARAALTNNAVTPAFRIGFSL